MSQAPGPLLFLRFQVMVAGSTTPMVTVPLPSQSPTTGIEVGLPYWNGARSGAPGALVLRSFQVAGGSPYWPGPSKTPTAVGAITRADTAVESLAGSGPGVVLLTAAELVRVAPF